MLILHRNKYWIKMSNLRSSSTCWNLTSLPLCDLWEDDTSSMLLYVENWYQHPKALLSSWFDVVNKNIWMLINYRNALIIITPLFLLFYVCSDFNLIIVDKTLQMIQKADQLMYWLVRPTCRVTHPLMIQTLSLSVEKQHKWNIWSCFFTPMFF